MSEEDQPSSIPPEFIELRRTEVRWQAIVRIVRTLIISGAIVALGYFLWQAAEAFAGTDTGLTVILGLLSNSQVKIILNISFTASITFLWNRERRLRKKTVQRMQSRIQALEQKLHKERTTSGLDTLGNTNPEDE